MRMRLRHPSHICRPFSRAARWEREARRDMRRTQVMHGATCRASLRWASDCTWRTSVAGRRERSVPHARPCHICTGTGSVIVPGSLTPRVGVRPQPCVCARFWYVRKDARVYRMYTRRTRACTMNAYCAPCTAYPGPRAAHQSTRPVRVQSPPRAVRAAVQQRAEPRTHRCLAAAAAAPVQPHVARTPRIVRGSAARCCRRGRDGSGGADAWALRQARVHGRTQDNGGCGMVMGEQSAGELRHNCVSGNECGLEVRPHRAALSYPFTALGFGPVLH
jgi:hypothetical protein